MSKFKHIVFPVDYSPRCIGTVVFVKQLARTHGSQLTLLYAAEPLPPTYSDVDVFSTMALYDLDQMRKVGQSRIENFAGQHFADLATELKVHSLCEPGDAALTITGYAQAVGADLIMMATHGYGKFRSLLIGSVTAKVLHDAQCSLWTGAHMEEAPAHEHVEIRQILCAIDLNRTSEDVIQRAIGMAHTHGAALRIIHSVSAGDARGERHFEEELRNLIDRATRGGKAATLAQEVVTEVRTAPHHESISKGVRSAALQHHADLVVVGRGGVHGSFGRLRTHAYAIIRDSPCPVLSV
ncbi:MAG: universal stress protein [Acidobacteriota bacterium]|nr:universal stress protein [Acidobacteriota bacterium]